MLFSIEDSAEGAGISPRIDEHIPAQQKSILKSQSLVARFVV